MLVLKANGIIGHVIHANAQFYYNNEYLEATLSGCIYCGMFQILEYVNCGYEVIKKFTFQFV